MLDSLESQIRKLRSLFWSDRDQEGQAFVALAEAYRRSGDLDQAVDLLNEGLERHPHHTSGIVVLGRVHRDRGEVSEARAAFERVVELDGENIEAIRGLGEVAAAEGAVEEARDRFQKVLELDPDDSDAMTALLDLETAVEQASGPDTPPVPEGEMGEAPEESFEEGSDEATGDWVDESWDAWGEEPQAESAPEARAEPEPELEAETGPDPDLAGEPEPEPEAEAGSDLEDEIADEPEVYTRTMAEVYASQGHVSRAIEVLEHILEEQPHDEAIRSRIEVLRQELGAGESPASAPVGQEPEPPDEAHLDELAEEMASAPHEDPIDTPFAWAAEEPQGEPTEAGGPTAREYFDGLLAWRPAPTEEVSGAMDPVVVPVADLGPDVVEAGPYDHLPLVSIQDLAPDSVGTDPSDRSNP